MDVGGMTWKADIWSSCEYEKNWSKVDRKCTLDPKYGCFIFKYLQTEVEEKCIKKPLIVCNFFRVKMSCHGWVSLAVFLQGMAVGQDHACMNTGTNKTRMHGNIFSNVFIDGQSGASKDRLQQKNDAETFSGKVAWKEMTFVLNGHPQT